MMKESRANSYLFGGNAPYVEELYEAYVAAGVTLAEFESSRFLRIKHVRQLQDEGVLDEGLRRRDSVIPGTARGS